MPNQKNSKTPVPEQARRVQTIIYITMAVFILAPIIVAWLSGSFNF
jgi:hypothetical protein